MDFLKLFTQDAFKIEKTLKQLEIDRKLFNPDKNGRNIFHALCVLNKESAKELIDYAFSNSDLDLEKNFFLKDKKGFDPIEYAILNDKPEILDYFKGHGVDFNKSKTNYITKAIVRGKGQTDVINKLASFGVDINKPDAETMLTPLQMAIAMRDDEAVETLLSHKADVNATSVDMEPPLHIAVLKGDIELAKLLCENGAIVDVSVDGRKNALELADRIHGKNSVIKSILLELGVKFDSKLQALPIAPLEDYNILFTQKNIKTLTTFLTTQKLNNSITTIDSKGNNILHAAVLNSNNNYSKELFTSIIDKLEIEDKKKLFFTANADGLTPLALAEKLYKHDWKSLIVKESSKLIETKTYRAPAGKSNFPNKANELGR